MKHLIYIVIFVICSLSNYISAKTLDTTDIKPKIQYGYVKTKGKINSNGTISPGKRLAGVTITLKGGISVISDASGNFQFKVFGNNFHIQNISKKGYLLVDPEVLSKTYAYSTNPLVISMETPDEQLEQRLANERKIRRTLQRTLQQREDEIEALKEQNKISEEEYRKALQKIYDEQSKNEKLISEMAERYSKTDYDQISEFDKEFNQYILNGEITKADSLLYSKGQLHEDIKEKEKNLEIKDELLKLKKEDLAHNCYKIFERYKLEYQNDSAAYYLELRASLDTTNIEWQLDAGNFILNNLNKTNEDIALNYFKRALIISLNKEKSEKDGNNNIVTSYLGLGNLYYQLGNFGHALNEYKKGEELFSQSNQISTLEYSKLAEQIAFTYNSMKSYDEALTYHQKALEIKLSLLNESDSDIGKCYNNIGAIYENIGNYNLSEEYYLKATDIFKTIYSNDSINENIAICYNNLGGIYDRLEQFDNAIEYYNKSIEIYNHLPFNSVGLGCTYNNLASTFYSLNNYPQAIVYYGKALNELKKIKNDNDPTIKTIKQNIDIVIKEMAK